MIINGKIKYAARRNRCLNCKPFLSQEEIGLLKFNGSHNDYNKKWYIENKEHKNEDRKKYYKNNRQHEGNISRANHYKNKGITIEQYDAMLLSQNNVCMICKQPEKSLQNGKLRRMSIDHNHKTGKIRDLLCSRCNMAIGLLLENPNIMRLAADYIERHNSLL